MTAIESVAGDGFMSPLRLAAEFAALAMRLAGYMALCSWASWAFSSIATIVASLHEPLTGQFYGGLPWTGLQPLLWTLTGLLGAALIPVSRRLDRWAYVPMVRSRPTHV